MTFKSLHVRHTQEHRDDYNQNLKTVVHSYPFPAKQTRKKGKMSISTISPSLSLCRRERFSPISQCRNSIPTATATEYKTRKAILLVSSVVVVAAAAAAAATMLFLFLFSLLFRLGVTGKIRQ
jgi:hypothetical protein